MLHILSKIKTARHRWVENIPANSLKSVLVLYLDILNMIFKQDIDIRAAIFFQYLTLSSPIYKLKT